MKKKITPVRVALGVAVAASLLMSANPAVAASGDLNANSGPAVASLTDKQVESRAADLAERYSEVGQVLSPADAAFVNQYLTVAEATDSSSQSRAAAAAAGATTVKATGKGGGQQGWLGGSMKINLSGAFSIDNSYNVDLSASGTKGVTKVKVCAHVRAYGVAGQGGVIVVYSNDPCGTGTSAYRLQRSERFTAYAVAGTITSDATFSYKGGSFQVHS